MIEDPLAEELLQGKWRSGDIVHVDADGDELTFTKTTGEIPEMSKRVHMDAPSARESWSLPESTSQGSAGGLDTAGA